MQAGRKSTFLDGVLILCIAVFGLACGGKTSTDGEMSHKEIVKLRQYLVSGRELYLRHCSNCHQADGKGLGTLYPPIDSSDFFDKYRDRVICIIRNGMEGEIKVNGITYNQPMPAIPELTDLDIAEIATYVYNNWGREAGLIDVRTVNKILGQCGHGQKEPDIIKNDVP